MNEIELEKFNKDITYEDGKIYWAEGKNYTSKLWENLKSNGYTTRSCRGFHILYDNNKNTIVETYGWLNALKELSVKMR